jgi:hypothetical protein
VDQRRARGLRADGVGRIKGVGHARNGAGTRDGRANSRRRSRVNDSGKGLRQHALQRTGSDRDHKRENLKVAKTSRGFKFATIMWPPFRFALSNADSFLA